MIIRSFLYVFIIILCLILTFGGLTAAIPIVMRAQNSHPLDPLSAAEILVAVATVRAAGATPEVL